MVNNSAMKEIYAFTAQIIAHRPNNTPHIVIIHQHTDIMEEYLQRSTYKLGVHPQMAHAFLVEAGPQSYEELMSLPEEERKKWQAAIDKENGKLKHLKTYKSVTLQDIPEDMRKFIVATRYVLTKKVSEAAVEEYKARLCAKDFKRAGRYIYEITSHSNNDTLHEKVEAKTYAPVVQTKSFRLVIALSAILNLQLHQFDVNSAFLHAKYNRKVYVKPPKGYFRENEYWQLLAALYGMRDAPREWFIEFRQFLTAHAFKEMKVLDECIYVCWLEDGSIILLAVHVDDNIAGRSRTAAADAHWKKFLAAATEKYGIKDMGIPKWCLGINIKTDTHSSISMNQKTYTEKALERLEFAQLTSISQPIQARKRAEPSSAQELDSDKHTNGKEEEVNHLTANATHTQNPHTEYYQRLIGTLIYLSIQTRPDIAFAVNSLARKMTNPTEEDVKDATAVFAYLKGTKNLGLSYKANTHNTVKPAEHELEISGFSDASYGDDSKDSKSTYGYILFINSMPIHWVSRKQAYVATSTTAAEYMAMSECVHELIWLYQLLTQMGLKAKKPVLYADNQPAIKTITGDNIQKTSSRRHIRIRFHHVRDEWQQGNIRIEYVQSKQNLADIFTKPLQGREFITMRERIISSIRDDSSAAEG